MGNHTLFSALLHLWFCGVLWCFAASFQTGGIGTHHSPYRIPSLSQNGEKDAGRKGEQGGMGVEEEEKEGNSMLTQRDVEVELQ